MSAPELRRAEMQLAPRDRRPLAPAPADPIAAGVEHHQSGRLDEAERLYRQISSGDASYPESLRLLGVLAYQRGQFGAAIEILTTALAVKPDSAEALYNLGLALQAQGKFPEAAARYRQALALKPNYARAANSLGSALNADGELEDAMASYLWALSIKPDFAEAYANLGDALSAGGQFTQAVASYRKALALRSDWAEVLNNNGNALRGEGKLDEALTTYRQALALKPDQAKFHSNLGSTLSDQNKLTEAVASYGRALACKPDYAEVHNNLGNVLSDQGRPAEAVVSYREALAIMPDFVQACSNLALCLNYCSDVSKRSLFAAHRDWQQRFGRPASVIAHANRRDPRRRLKVGYVSPNLRQHSVAFFIEPLLREHDRNAVDVHCYAEVSSPDAVTDRLRRLSDHWLTTVNLSDDALAERIQSDDIDILIDLAGHTGENRLGVFTRKPAPVQVTWLGYPNTTGLDAIDYRLVDTVTDPVGEADQWASETLVRLEGGFLCYLGLTEASEPCVPPSLSSGIVTFGSFNSSTKLSDATLDLWGSLLQRLPHSRLLLKAMAFADPGTGKRLMSRFIERGIAAERVELVGWHPGVTVHLRSYERVDIALDPLPYNGTTTTCEALWMGVPVVTLRGDRHAARVGASLLTQASLTEWIADSPEAYVQIAERLASNPTRLNNLRHRLRSHLAASALCDAPGFARKIEAAYRKMWRDWCETFVCID